MKTTDLLKQEQYVSPETEILSITLNTCILEGSIPPIEGGDDPDIPVG